MATPAENVEFVREGLEDWIAGNREEAIARFADDIEVFVPAELGNAGTFRGIEGFRGWFDAWYEAWSEFNMEFSDIRPAGDRHVTVMITSRGTGAGSGIEVENTLAWVIGVREAKMDFLSLQVDRAAAEALAAEREAGDPGAGPTA